MDGTFEGEANGYRPGLKVSVDIKNNKITSIRITSYNVCYTKLLRGVCNCNPSYSMLYCFKSLLSSLILFNLSYSL